MVLKTWGHTKLDPSLLFSWFPFESEEKNSALAVGIYPARKNLKPENIYAPSRRSKISMSPKRRSGCVPKDTKDRMERDLLPRRWQLMHTGVLAVVNLMPFSDHILTLNQFLQWCTSKSTLEFSGNVPWPGTVIQVCPRAWGVSPSMALLLGR